MAIGTVCDECGVLIGTSSFAGWVWLNTGRVIRDGYEDLGQDAHLCPLHYPEDGEMQPRDCKRVRFSWGGK